MPKAPWSNSLRTNELNDEEKLSILALLPAGESVLFEMPDYGFEEDSLDVEVRYFDLDISGLYYLDLDDDGDLDLIYSGQNGPNNIMGSKVYLNSGGKFVFHSNLRGGIIDLHKTKTSYAVYTLWVPCCDSYTSSIRKYDFSADSIGSLNYTIAIIGLRHIGNGLPNFDAGQSAILNNPSLFAFREDFKRTSPYFKKRTRAIKDSLKAGHPLELIRLKGQITVNILYQEKRSDGMWNLVITHAINNAPKSLYEWSHNKRMRFVGWVRQEEFD